MPIVKAGVPEDAHKRIGKFAAERRISKKTAYERVICAVLDVDGHIKRRARDLDL